jgi:S1-C subfamily serine protease
MTGKALTPQIQIALMMIKLARPATFFPRLRPIQLGKWLPLGTNPSDTADDVLPNKQVRNMSRCSRISLLIFVLLSADGNNLGAQTGDSSDFFSSTVYISADAQIIGSIEHRKFTSSGVIITPEGHVLTTAHSIPDLADPQTYTNVKLTGVIGNKYGYPIPLDRVGLYNAQADLIILKFPSGVNLNFKPASVAKDLSVQRDSYVTVVGFPLKLDASILHGRIVTLNGDGDTWVTDARVQEGSSGGPVFDSFGQLIGIVAGGFQATGNAQPLGLNTIIPISKAISLGAGLKWQFSEAPNRVQCKSTAVTLAGTTVTFPPESTTPLVREIRPAELSGVLASSYPWVIVDGGTVRLPPTGPNIFRFCRLELKNGAQIIVGPDQVRVLTNFLFVQNGRFVGVDQSGLSLHDPDPVIVVGQAGRPGESGRSSGPVLLATLVRFDGTLPFQLDGEHGGNGGIGGPGTAGSAGAPGVGGSDSLLDCRRGPGDGERGSPGGQGGPGGPGGPGGNGGNLQIFHLTTTIFPTGSISYAGRGGKGGSGGLGGQGGSGGNGGPRGSETTFCHGGNPGPKGPSGPNGPSGTPGPDGLDGKFENIVVSEQDIINLF